MRSLTSRKTHRVAAKARGSPLLLVPTDRRSQRGGVLADARTRLSPARPDTPRHSGCNKNTATASPRSRPPVSTCGRTRAEASCVLRLRRSQNRLRVRLAVARASLFASLTRTLRRLFCDPRPCSSLRKTCFAAQRTRFCGSAVSRFKPVDNEKKAESAFCGFA